MKNGPSPDTFSIGIGWWDYRIVAYPDGTIVDVHVRGIDERSWKRVTGPMRDAVIKEWNKRQRKEIKHDH